MCVLFITETILKKKVDLYELCKKKRRWVHIIIMNNAKRKKEDEKKQKQVGYIIY